VKRVIVLFLLLCFSLFAGAAYAHPPLDIKITFNSKTGVIKAVIYHQVNDSSKHYIKKVDIGINGKEIGDLKFSRQDNLLTQTISYTIKDFKPGDKISVEAYCNLSGKLEKKIEIK
jgi:desulfoferrodoxin (superoxide reductase-like protein)